jgi:hypothetical protein
MEEEKEEEESSSQMGIGTRVSYTNSFSKSQTLSFFKNVILP